VDDAKPPRRRFQFSLRRLMLWMVALGVYLSVLRWAGAGTLFTVVSTVWLVCLVFIQIVLGPKMTHPREQAAIRSSMRWSGVATVCVTVCLLVGLLVWHEVPRMGCTRAMMGPPILGVALGTFLGILVYFPVFWVVQIVNLIDSLIQNKMPLESDQQTHDSMLE
jgi:hypothetical protein